MNHASTLALCLCLSTAAFAADPGFQVVSVSKGDLAAELAKHAAEARKQHLKPFVEFTADWCKPCAAIKKYLHDPQMEAAFTGVYLIQVDFNEFDGKAAESAGFKVIGIPTFFEIDEKAKPSGRQITSSVWGDDIPANMAPPLKKFFASAK